MRFRIGTREVVPMAGRRNGGAGGPRFAGEDEEELAARVQRALAEARVIATALPADGTIRIGEGGTAQAWTAYAIFLASLHARLCEGERGKPVEADWISERLRCGLQTRADHRSAA